MDNSVLTVEKFVDNLCACVDSNGNPNKLAMYKYIISHLVFYSKNYYLIEAEINRRYEIERLSLDGAKILDDNQG